MKKLLGIATFLILFSGVTTLVHAGGGQYEPRSFSHGQVINGKSFQVEFAVHDMNNGGFIVGEDFEIVAHHDLSNADCQTTQRTSDGNGIVKGNCHADGVGLFVFEIQPITKRNIQNGSSWEVYFTNNPAPATVHGFVEQGSQNSEGVEAVIVQSPAKIKLGTTFTVEVKIKKNGQLQADTSLIQGVKWTVLKGSMVTLGAPEENNCVDGKCKNRKLNIQIDQKNTTVVADVALTTGENIKTGAKAFVVELPASPTPSPSPKPLQTTTTLTAQLTSTLSATPTATIVPENTVAAPAVEKSQPTLWVRFQSWIKSWWFQGRN